ncbi:hypothetical protein Trydic_g22936 [Trypoxylus dichotomus]
MVADEKELCENRSVRPKNLKKYIWWNEDGRMCMKARNEPGHKRTILAQQHSPAIKRETKQHSRHWRYNGSPTNTKFKQSDRKHILHIEFLTRGGPLRTKDVECSVQMFLHNNVQPRSIQLIRAILQQFHLEAFEYLPYRPDLDRSGFHFVLHFLQIPMQ